MEVEVGSSSGVWSQMKSLIHESVFIYKVKMSHWAPQELANSFHKILVKAYTLRTPIHVYLHILVIENIFQTR